MSQNPPHNSSAGKEITAQALGAAVATLTVISIEWATGTQAPAGAEGSLAVIAGAGVGLVRKWVRDAKENTA